MIILQIVFSFSLIFICSKYVFTPFIVPSYREFLLIVKYFCISILVIFLFLNCSNIQRRVFYKNSETGFYFDNKWAQESLKKENELFHIVASSNGYDVRQVGFQEKIKWINNESGNKLFQKEISLYNKIDYIGESLVQIGLYKGTGKIGKVRFLQTSGVSELDKLIIDDITRWKIDYIGEDVFDVDNNRDKEKNKLESTLVRYTLILKNQTSKKEDKKYLKEQEENRKR